MDTKQTKPIILKVPAFEDFRGYLAVPYDKSVDFKICQINQGWLRGLPRMDEMVEDYGIDIPLWEKIMDQQGSVCCAWEKTAFEEGMKVGIRLMMEVMK